MTVKCDACGARLKVREESLGGRLTARCPKCQGRVNLRQETGGDARTDKILVACTSCGARLKAPASRLGTTSRCPRCRETIKIVAEPLAAAAAAGSGDPEESSGAATRRIDSRTLGVDLAAMARSSHPEGMNLDDFIKSTPTRREETPTPGIAESLVKPDTEPLREAAEGIRRAAEEIAEPAAPAEAPVAGQDRKEAPAEKKALSTQPARETSPRRSPSESPARPSRRAAAAFPSSRGFLVGALSGAVVGGAWAAAADRVGEMGMGWLVAPVSFVGSLPVEIPEAALRVILLVLLGAMTGFVAAALGSPTTSDRPLSLVRCGGVALVAGIAFGLLSTLAGGATLDSLAVWPTVNWMRDVLLVGLFTPALNKMIPGPRT